MTTLPHPANISDRLRFAVAAAFIFALAYFSISYAYSDPKLTLVVSQSILQNGTVALDNYQQDDILGRPFAEYVAQNDIIVRNGHYYDYFPVGPAVMSVPFVAIANALDFDMRTKDNIRLQNLLSALSCVAIFAVVWQFGRYLLPARTALFLSFVSITGSGLISTLATALWSLNFSALFLALSLLILIKQQTQPTKNQWAGIGQAYLLGLLLFLAFFSRASAAAFIVPVLIYLLIKRWRFALVSGLVAGGWLVVFLLVSNAIFGSWLPDYYGVARLQVERTPVWIALLGNTISPSRGIFVYSPFWLLLIFGVGLRKRMAQQPLVWVCLAWFGLHLWLVARAAIWWGGWSFGPRILADASLALATLFFIFWQAASQQFSSAKMRLLTAAYVVLAVVAIGINSGQGLYSQATVHWYKRVTPIPSIHSTFALGDMFRPRIAQPIASNRINCDLDAQKTTQLVDGKTALGTLPLGEWVTFDDASIHSFKTVVQNLDRSPKPVLIGWAADLQDVIRWSVCERSSVVFSADNLNPTQHLYTITLRLYGTKPQPVNVYLNDFLIESGNWSDATATNGELYLSVDNTMINAQGHNTLTFEFPEAKPNSLLDQRLLGIGLAGIKLEPNADDG